MLLLTRGRMRTAATALTAGVLAATTLAFAASPAQAADTPTVEATVSFADGIDVTVDGTNFDPSWNEDALGVYVALAEKQDIFSAPDDVDFFSRDWVTPQRFTDGAFTSELTIDPADVEAGKDYAVYTWTAHGNPTVGDTQYTETDVVLTDAESELAAPSVTATATADGKYVDIAIDGSNFDPAARPGAMGVYVALSKKRNIFGDESDDQESGMENFIGSDWVMPGQFNDGAFSKTLTVEKSKLVKGMNYAIYTWTAHGNPTAGDTQYTQTVVNIPGLPKNKAKLALKVKKKPTTKKKGRVKIAVKSAVGVKTSGKVKIALKKGKQTKKANGKLNKKGKVAVKLPKLKKGKWKLTVKYLGDKNYKVAKKAVKFKVKK